MESVNSIAPFAMFVLGGASVWWGHRLREQKERKAAIGIALADLLEVRHWLLTVNWMIEKFRELKIPEETMPHLRNVIDTLLGPRDDLNARYAKAVTVVAAVDPLTAFHLTSKNLIPQFLSGWRNFAMQQGVNLKELELVENDLHVAVKPRLDDAVANLARAYSWRTCRSVRKMVEQKLEIPPELQGIFDRIRDSGTAKP